MFAICPSHLAKGFWVGDDHDILEPFLFGPLIQLGNQLLCKRRFPCLMLIDLLEPGNPRAKTLMLTPCAVAGKILCLRHVDLFMFQNPQIQMIGPAQIMEGGA